MNLSTGLATHLNILLEHAGSKHNRENQTPNNILPESPKRRWSSEDRFCVSGFPRLCQGVVVGRGAAGPHGLSAHMGLRIR